MTAYNMIPDGFVQAFGKYSNKQTTVILYFHLPSCSDTFENGPMSDVVKCLKQTFWEQWQKL